MRAGPVCGGYVSSSELVAWRSGGNWGACAVGRRAAIADQPHVEFLSAAGQVEHAHREALYLHVPKIVFECDFHDWKRDFTPGNLGFGKQFRFQGFPR